MRDYGSGKIILKKFYSALEEVLKMKIENFLEQHKDVLPKFEVVHENKSVEEVLKHLREDKHYIIVIDRKGKMRGIITYIDFMIMFGKKRTTALFAPFSSVTRSLKRAHMPLKTLAELKASDIMNIAPPHVWNHSKVEDALNNMSKTGNNFAVVIAKGEKVVGIITAHAIFRAIIRKAEL